MAFDFPNISADSSNTEGPGDNFDQTDDVTLTFRHLNV